VSLLTLQNNAGWTSPAIPDREYADQGSLGAGREAARAASRDLPETTSHGGFRNYP